MNAALLVLALVVVAVMVLIAATLMLVLRRRSAPDAPNEMLRAGQAPDVSARQASDRAQGASAWTRIGGGGSGI